MAPPSGGYNSHRLAQRLSALKYNLQAKLKLPGSGGCVVIRPALGFGVVPEKTLRAGIPKFARFNKSKSLYAIARLSFPVNGVFLNNDRLRYRDPACQRAAPKNPSTAAGEFESVRVYHSV